MFFPFTILHEIGTKEEIMQFMISDQFDDNDTDDNVINSFKEWIEDGTDSDLEQEYKLSYDK